MLGLRGRSIRKIRGRVRGMIGLQVLCLRVSLIGKILEYFNIWHAEMEFRVEVIGVIDGRSSIWFESIIFSSR